MQKMSRWWESFTSVPTLSSSRVRQVIFSVTDQGLSIGAIFLANIALARTQTKEEYGVFALSYTVLTFLTGLHNAAILEAFTVYGSGRYREYFQEYSRLLWRANAALGFGLTVTLLLVWRVLTWSARGLALRSFLGLALACGVLLTASFVRRTFYMRQRPDLAAKFSLIYFAASVVFLWLMLRAGILNGFYVFVILTSASIIAAALVARELPGRAANKSFTDIEPAYWSEHWKYARWVFVTAFICQFTAQGYYWLAAVFLSVKEVGDLRALYNVVAPMDQIFVAIGLLVLPIFSFRYTYKHISGLVPLWRAYCLGWLLVTGVFAVVVNVFGRPVMHVVYAGRFDDIASLLGILALVPVVMGVGNTMNVALKSMEKPNAVFYAYVASGAATFLLGLPLLIHFGLRGAVYGMLASGAVYTIALGIAFFSIVYAAGTPVQLVTPAKEDLFLRNLR
jgi:O-antigen/teichoic acid export membrane protein